MCVAILTTRTGLELDVTRPGRGSFRLADMGWALSRVPRFGGHARWHYSVAEHAVRVSRRLPDELRLWGLLHDGAEAYLGDLVWPVKQLFPEYIALEDVWLQALAEWAELPWPMPIAVDSADLALRDREWNVVMVPRDPWTDAPRGGDGPAGLIVPAPDPDWEDPPDLREWCWQPVDAMHAWLMEIAQAPGVPARLKAEASGLLCGAAAELLRTAPVGGGAAAWNWMMGAGTD